MLSVNTCNFYLIRNVALGAATASHIYGREAVSANIDDRICPVFLSSPRQEDQLWPSLSHSYDIECFGVGEIPHCHVLFRCGLLLLLLEMGSSLTIGY